MTFKNGEKMQKIFNGKIKAKLGTEKNPAAVTVQTEERKREIESLFEENGWAFTIELNPDIPENTNDLDILRNPQKTKIAEKKPGRNDPCTCGSGKKYKKCCGE